MGTKALNADSFDEVAGRTILKMLDSAGMTQADLAEVTGISTSRLSRLLRGERPMLIQELNRIAEVLQLKGSELFDLIEAIEQGSASAAAAAAIGSVDEVVFGEGDGRLADNGDDVDDVLALIEEARRSGVGLAALESDPRLAESEDFFD